MAGDGLDGTDEVSCDARHEAVIRFHLAPGLTARRVTDAVEVRDGGSLVTSIQENSLAWRVDRTPYHPEFGKVRVAASPVQFANEPPTVRNHAPEIGADTETVLLEAGLSWEEMGTLKDGGVIS